MSVFRIAHISDLHRGSPHDSRTPHHGQERIIRFSADMLEFEKHTGRIEDELRSGR